MWAADNISHDNILFYSLYYDTISLTSLKITQAFQLLLGFAENQIFFWDFKIRNSVQITEGSDNRDSNNQGSTVLLIDHKLRVLYETCTPEQKAQKAGVASYNCYITINAYGDMAVSIFGLVKY